MTARLPFIGHLRQVYNLQHSVRSRNRVHAKSSVRARLERSARDERSESKAAKSCRQDSNKFPSLRRRLARNCSQQAGVPSTRGLRVLGWKPDFGLMGRSAAERALTVRPGKGLRLCVFERANWLLKLTGSLLLDIPHLRLQHAMNTELPVEKNIPLSCSS